MQKLIEKANILAEALPYINKLNGKTVVVKYGGNAMGNEDITKTILEDIALLKIVGVNPVLVHGGGPEINAMLKNLNVQSSFHNGLRITDKSTMEVVQMVLCGKLNKDITSKLNCLGVKAVGICGKDAKLIEVKKKQSDVDLGFVGEIVSVNTHLIKMLADDEYIPVIAGVGSDERGNSYNINADTAAVEIAAAMGAEKLIFLTDVDGIRRDEKDPATLIPVISVGEIEKMIEEKKISGGMIPKVNACIKSVKMGIKRTHIVNGTIPHPVMLEIFTDSGIGTMITE
jgi:acetylglutamate kinase